MAERNPTKGQRPLEWMRFDPVEFGLLCDGLTFAEVGALTKVMLHLWQRGPLSEADVRRVAKGESDTIVELLTQHGDGMSLDLVESAREYGEGRRRQRSDAGKASAAKRNDRSTTVERPLNDRVTDVLSMSVSVSSSNSEKKERAQKFEIQWPEWAGPNTKAKWEEFKAYRQALDRFRYKSPASEQAAINTLAKYYTRGQDMVSGIDLAMAKGWKFPVDPAELHAVNGKPAQVAPSPSIKPWMQ
jgi:hypothetical protein